MIKEKIDYVEQDIYDYFGADQNIWNAERHELLGIIGGMSGILELIWHKQVTPERSLKDFAEWSIGFNLGHPKFRKLFNKYYDVMGVHQN